MADDNSLDLLVVIFDANPVWWGRVFAEKSQEQITLTSCVDSMIVMCNAHLMMKQSNTLAFIASNTRQSKFLFPKESLQEMHTIEESRSVPSDSRCEKFVQMDDLIVSEIKELIGNSEIPAQENPVHSNPPSALPSALCMALCYIHRKEKECPVGLKLKPRIMVVKASPDNASQYLTIMNCIFGAQKSNVIIDACALYQNSGFLQQAADITGGVYLKIENTLSILEHLLWLYLPGQGTRDMLILPSSQHIDYRAACFCHRKLVDIGYVCSVCLSIYCQFIPRCITCQTLFKLPLPPPLQRSKKKKK
ncbi:general transcription factor IIH subunit 3-like [Actinia tenebrosa]|uniref:General transcription factor IIH subunit 3 n=1 Tax=Actinia tenebrosa TaxID=6105 RepID=A0A6P8HXM2_ACTTE|nr:general transcription factor IIH subunit 3-like [Actinia tenebrosa]